MYTQPIPTKTKQHSNGNGHHPNGIGNGNGHKKLSKNPAPPHNIEAEEAVIGSALIDQDVFFDGVGDLSPDDFFLARNRVIFEAMQKFHDAGKRYDYLTISDEVERCEHNDIVPKNLLADMAACTPTSINAHFYADIVGRDALARRLIRAGADITKIAYANDLEPAELQSEVEKILLKSISRQRDKSGLKPARIAAEEVVNRVERIQLSPNSMMGIPTPFKDLNCLIGGLQRSDMIIIAGRPSMGKSSFALQTGVEAAKKYGARVAIFSIEMSSEQLMQRGISMLSGIDSQRIRLGKIAEDEWPSFVQASAEISELPLYIDDSGLLTPSDLRTRTIKMHAMHGLDLVIVDYLQLMKILGFRGSRYEMITEISGSIKQLARELNVPIMALSQLSRSLESRHDKRPILSDLKESGAIEQDADIVGFIYRDEIYNSDTEFPNVAEIIIAKHRNGATGLFSVYHKKTTTQFVDLEVKTQPIDWIK